jgi:hypothetical protein
LYILIFKFFDSNREYRRFWTEWYGSTIQNIHNNKNTFNAKFAVFCVLTSVKRNVWTQLLSISKHDTFMQIS